MSPMKNDKETGLTYWRRLDELARTPEFQEAVQREFPVVLNSETRQAQQT